MKHLLEQISLSFRLGLDAKANDDFAKFMDTLEQQLPQIATRLDLNILNQLLNEMFQAQSRGDYLYLADLLEYEIEPLLFP